MRWPFTSCGDWRRSRAATCRRSSASIPAMRHTCSGGSNCGPRASCRRRNGRRTTFDSCLRTSTSPSARRSSTGSRKRNPLGRGAAPGEVGELASRPGNDGRHVVGDDLRLVRLAEGHPASHLHRVHGHRSSRGSRRLPSWPSPGVGLGRAVLHGLSDGPHARTRASLHGHGGPGPWDRRAGHGAGGDPPRRDRDADGGTPTRGVARPVGAGAEARVHRATGREAWPTT